MSSKYNNLFVGVYNSVKGTPLSAWVLILSILLLVIGANNFLEDTYSSFAGIQMIEKQMNMNPATWQFTYWAMSLFFQVIAVISFFIYLSDRKENWYWFWVAMASQVVDFMADVWYRSNEQLFVSLPNFALSLILTFVFFTAGSELAITVGFGLVATMFKDGFTQFGQIVSGLLSGFAGAGKAIAGGKTLVENHSDQQHQNQPQRPYERQDIPPEVLARLQQFQGNRHPSVVIEDVREVVPAIAQNGNHNQPPRQNNQPRSGGGKKHNRNEFPDR